MIKKSKRIIFIISLVIILFLIILGGGFYYLNFKLNKVQKVEVNKDNLSINKAQVYEEKYIKTLLYLVLMLLKEKSVGVMLL
ncbi:hypothetical protein CYK87_09955 [Clostridium perfringens]|nr:hypothetical protein CYK87_09955 [Clostridium perfringens]